MIFVAGEPAAVADALARALAAVTPAALLASDDAPAGATVVTLGETVDPNALVTDPRGALNALCETLGIRFDQAMLSPFEALARDPDAAQSPFRSVSTSTFGERLADVASSLLVSTYQTNRLVIVRTDGNDLNTHLRTFDKPMGIALTGDRLALGTRTEVWDFRDMPAAAAKLDSDACYLPRNRHVTGDIAVHELAFAAGRLWAVATGFSCLVCFDLDHSFVPVWKPPWMDTVGPGDACHLNGLCVVDDAVRYVTALGQTTEPGGWRPGKASGGVVVDVVSNEIVAAGLSMPHSPRWHDGRLFVLESGRGEIGVVDLATGDVEVVAELPGFTRGLAFAGGTAFVGLSQIRETSTFGDLPLVERLDERLCGVWSVDLASGAVEGFLRFDDLVQEVFDVAVLPGRRWPEVAEPDGETVAASYAVP